jgi:hypothetical protein
VTATTPTAQAGAPTERDPRRSRRRTFALIASVLGVVAVAALGVHLYAESAYRRSLATTATLEQRAAAARLAARIEPWNARFATRATVMGEWLLGSQLLAQGKYLASTDLLAVAYRRDVGDKELLALFVKSQDLLTVSTNWKAHVQHAREGPGGTLRPQDVIP